MHAWETRTKYTVTILSFVAACGFVGLGFHTGIFDVRSPLIPSFAGMIVGAVVGYGCGRLIAALHAAANGVFPMGFLSARKRNTGLHS